ncbi:hypothetical protein AB0D91_37840 [Streptomyces canus]|uniref:hypothetical protein n=1 Tax=Streptomyces canus TaxID=58343 RepID=UPI0033CD584A
MDAGLAAVLGAAVGAVGTGGAAIATALLNRSQARLQLRAEHVRLLRQTRQTIYARFTEALQTAHESLFAVERKLRLYRADEPDAEAKRAEIERAFDIAQEQTEVLSTPAALVAIEAPFELSDRSDKAAHALSDYRNHLMVAVAKIGTGEEFASDDAEEARNRREGTIRANIRFRLTASEVLNDDGMA